MKKYDVCIVGATGVVGRMFLSQLDALDFPIGRLRLLASSRSAGAIIPFKGVDHQVEELGPDSFAGFQIAFFSAGGAVSKIYGPLARQAGLTVIDNSSMWRMDPEIGLVVPELNLEDALKNKLIANPNCSTIQCVVPLGILHKAFGLKKVFYSTYQAVSGSGQKGLDDLERTLHGEKPAFYPHDISQTCIPEIDVFLENGYTKEEMKMVEETRKILHLPFLPVSATCIRVPVARGHGVSVRVELEKPFELSQVRSLFGMCEGVVLLDNGPAHDYPLSTISRDNNNIYVGRIRRDLSDPAALLFYCVADNLCKGAAGNGVQIALAMIQKGYL